MKEIRTFLASHRKKNNINELTGNVVENILCFNETLCLRVEIEIIYEIDRQKLP